MPNEEVSTVLSPVQSLEEPLEVIVGAPVPDIATVTGADTTAQLPATDTVYCPETTTIILLVVAPLLHR